MIAITGTTGNMGGRITADLLSKGQHVRCIARTVDNLICPVVSSGGS